MVPILFATPEQTMIVSQTLLDAGIYAPPIVQVGVPKDLPRIRFFISAEHTRDQMEKTIGLIAEIVASFDGADAEPRPAIAGA